jgi:hypothetical protein
LSLEVEAMFANSRFSNVHRLSFDAKQQKFEEILDEKLTICRG